MEDSKQGTCGVCREQKHIVSDAGDIKVCQDCIESFEECPCSLCEFEASTDKWIGTYDTYGDHLLAKHKHEELAEYISTKAKADRDKRYRV